jgi:hypothetical protein
MSVETVSAASLIDQAEAVLSGTTMIHRAHASRAACWLGRAAMEFAVDALLLKKRYDGGASNMRSRLICLRAAFGADSVVVSSAAAAWAGLSAASHQHAYELSPTVAEVERMLKAVRRIEVAASGDGNAVSEPSQAA